MITRGDVQRVIDAFILEETLYWWLHPMERVQTVRGIDVWDGYHWTLARKMAQDGEWVSLKAYMDTLGETYLRVYGIPRSVRVPSIVPRVLDGMLSRRRRRRPSTQRPRFRQNGRGIMTLLAKAAKIGYRLGRDKRYKRMGAKSATGHTRRLPRPWE